MDIAPRIGTDTRKPDLPSCRYSALGTDEAVAMTSFEAWSRRVWRKAWLTTLERAKRVLALREVIVHVLIWLRTDHDNEVL